MIINIHKILTNKYINWYNKSIRREKEAVRFNETLSVFLFLAVRWFQKLKFDSSETAKRGGTIMDRPLAIFALFILYSIIIIQITAGELDCRGKRQLLRINFKKYEKISSKC